MHAGVDAHASKWAEEERGEALEPVDDTLSAAARAKRERENERKAGVARSAAAAHAMLLWEDSHDPSSGEWGVSRAIAVSRRRGRTGLPALAPPGSGLGHKSLGDEMEDGGGLMPLSSRK